MGSLERKETTLVSNVFSNIFLMNSGVKDE
nr:MAG TPA: hypothetical protein [Caudoviricetes sp.]